MQSRSLPAVGVLVLAVVVWSWPAAAQQASRPAAPPRIAERAPPRGGVVRASNNEPQAQPPANPRAAQPASAGPPQPPFQLTDAQQQLLDQILKQWEKHSDRVKSFKCTFGVWEVNQAFGPPENNYVLTEGQGEIKFKAPDQGTYKIKSQVEWDAQKKAYVPRSSELLDHWVCNGKSIFEYNAQKRQVIERPLAPELQGKAIANGPLPFVFGAKADQLQRRYWMRDITPGDEVNNKIRLEAWPKFQQDAANFHHAIVILNHRDFMPDALRIVLPDGRNTQDYKFENTVVNNPLAILTGDFLPPLTPLGWTKVIEQPASQQAPPPPASPQARRRADATRK
jgi:TIGR03009 family protein